MHQPEGAPFRILTDGEALTGVDDGTAQVGNPLQGSPNVPHPEVGQGHRIARTSASRVKPQLGPVAMRLPTVSFIGAAGVEAYLQHAPPEPSGALGIIGRKLDQRDRGIRHGVTIADCRRTPDLHRLVPEVFQPTPALT